jgi:NAD-dependent SIR2 family protein deacetylase
MKKIIVYCGAGISANSGLATYRSSSNSLYDDKQSMHACHKNQKYTPENFNFYKSFFLAQKKAFPNKCHEILRELSCMCKAKIYSQNVDTLLERAGCENQRVCLTKLHGTCDKMLCESCNLTFETESLHLEDRPKCEKCHSPLTFAILHFGEKLPYDQLLEDLLDCEKDDVILILGTSLTVFPLEKFIKPIKCKKIYVNLDTIDYIDTSAFTEVHYTTCEIFLERFINEL